MNSKIYFVLLCFLSTGLSLKAQTLSQEPTGATFEQPQPFLYTVTTLNPAARQWSLNYSGGYGQNTITPVGFNGVDQNIAVMGYLGSRITMLASMGVGFGSSGNVQTIQQAEFLKDFIGGKSVTGFRLGTSLGLRREYTSDMIALTRVNAAYETLGWKLGANVRFEKAFTTGRDKLDVITTVGIQRHISGQLFGGIEAVGQDLEGLWDTEETEGGARILVGPSLNFVPVASRLSFALCVGPIIQASHSTLTYNDSAVRDLPLINNGFTVKFNVGFRFQ